MWARLAVVAVFAFLVAIFMGPPASQAEGLFGDEFPGEFGGYTGFGTEYNWRGVSQSDEEPSVQGEIDYSVGLSDAVDFYVSVWGSNVDFGATPDAFGDATIEIDYFGGFTGGLGAAGLTWDIGAIGYTYPGVDSSANFDFVEAYGGLAYDFGVASASFYIYATPELFGDSGDAQYYSGDIGVPLPNGLGLGFHVARFVIDENDTFGLPDYTDWKIALTVAVLGFDLEFAYIDTDMSETECFGGSELCEARFVFFASRSF